jgi:hypothetical protein
MLLRNIVILFLFPILGYSQIQIEGLVLDKIKKTPLPESRVTLAIFKRDTLIIGDSTEFHPYRVTFLDTIYRKYDQIITDSTGRFFFSNLAPTVYKITAENLLRKTQRGSYYEEREMIIYNATNCDSRLDQNIYLSVFCLFDSTKRFTLCPKCGKDDQLRIFIWGLGYPLGGDDNKYIYTGDCSPPRCKPAKYCQRCKLEF